MEGFFFFFPPLLQRERQFPSFLANIQVQTDKSEKRNKQNVGVVGAKRDHFRCLNELRSHLDRFGSDCMLCLLNKKRKK